MTKEFCHLHLHDEFSALDGFGSPKKYAEKAARLGMKYLGVTNHGNIDSAIKFQQACLDNGIEPVIGCELYIDEDRNYKEKDSQRKHINVFVKNHAGWKNLLSMLTIANLEGFYKRPRIDPKTLLDHLDGLIISTACTSGFIGCDWGMILFKKLVKLIPEDLYLEIQPHDWDQQVEWNKNCITLSKEYGIKLLATNDCHYPELEDNVLQEILLAISSRVTWDDPKRWKFDLKTLFLCSRNKMISYFKTNHPYLRNRQIREALENTVELAQKCCDFRVKKQAVHLPLIPGVEERGEELFFKKLVKRGFREKIAGQVSKEDLKVYKDRVEEELELLISKGFTRYFLIVWEIINWCNENNIYTGPGRGSAAGSLVSYLLGITDVDPIKYGLVFSRFVTEEREDNPDIDIDFEQDRREEVIEHIKDLYGKNNVIQISTYLSMKGKMALQDVGRVFNVTRKEITEVTKLIELGDEISVDYFANSKIAQLRRFYKAHPKVVEYACRIQDTIRGYGKHAAGVVISSDNLYDGDKCNLCKRSNSMVANWDKDDAEYMGLMKLDILGLTELSKLHECVDLIKKNHDIDIDLKKLSKDDKAVFQDITAGDTIGVFQLQTRGITDYCKDLKIDSFKDIYDALALFRPGPLGSGMSNEFLLRKHGKKWKAIHKNVEKLTKDTFGILVYQEQVMRMANELAGFEWGKCEKLRKVIAKSKGEEEFNKFKAAFVSGCVEKGTLCNELATKLFEDIVSFSKYSFNLSHSVSYAFISYCGAWLKHYYPVEYFASVLTYTADNDSKKRILEAGVERGLKVKLPKVGISDPIKWRCLDNCLVMPFTEIVGVGDIQAQSIADESNKKRVGFFDSVSSQNLPTKLKQILVDIHAYDSHHEITYNEFKTIKNYFKYNLLEILGF